MPNSNTMLIATSEPMVKKTITVGRDIRFVYKIEPIEPNKEIEEVDNYICTRIVHPILLSGIDVLKNRFLDSLPVFESKLKELSSQMISMMKMTGDEESVLLRIAELEYSTYEVFKALTLTRNDIDVDYIPKTVQLVDNLRSH